MTPQSLRERFNTSKEELAKLGLEFNSEALPLLEKLYVTTFWILLNKRAAKKIIKQTFFEAIENCDITKNYADWNSWIHRIWMREILEFYSEKENDKQTVFDFIDHAEVNLNAVENFFNSKLPDDKLIKSLEKLPAVLRIPMMMKEIHSLNYEIISDLIDVPVGVIATRIYRARKLLYLFLRDNFDYEEQKRTGIQQGSSKLIFELRQSAQLVDDELSLEQKAAFNESTTNSNLVKAETLIQGEIKKLFSTISPDDKAIGRMRAKIERKATKRFGKQD
ncbi:MAG: sigma factor-like helix-turn-helix DNA-binding protein [Ignavibacteriaceae bacterium]|nr:sigma factor-like helix-turn-helix DNA-binding protein [Ignavibacteriaceae bacterium]